MMPWIRTVFARCLDAVRRERLNREFDEELNTHLELLTDEYRRRGLSAADAQRAAIRKLGRPDALRESYREQRGLPLLDAARQDVRYALRMLGKTPAFTVIITLSLALGIGANTTLFSLVNALLLRSLPLHEPDRIYQVQQVLVGMGIRKPRLTYPRAVFDSLRAESPVISQVVGFAPLDRPEITIDGAAEPPREVEQVSANYFDDLGVTPQLGRGPTPSDGAVAVLSNRLWHARFGGSANVLGGLIAIDGRPHTIVGVAPARFLGLSIERPTDVWVSSQTDANLQMIARLKPGVTAAQAQAALRPLLPQPPDVPQLAVELLPAGRGLSQLRSQYEGPLLALAVLVTLLLLLTCANVGSLLMVRNTGRSRELTVRVALGAARSRLIQQYLVESAVLAALGGAVALVFARWGVSILLSMLPLAAIPESLTFQAEARVLGFAAGVSLLSALLFGLVPALRATQVDLTTALRPTQGTTSPAGARRLGRWLVGCQVGLSVLLLVGAGLFVQTLRNLTHLAVGFNPDNLLQVSIDTRSAGYREGQVAGVYRLLLERVAAIPGVRSVTGVRNGVMQGASSRGRCPIPGRTLDPDEAWEVADVGPVFFETMGIAVLRGRAFTAADFAQARPIAAISETFAKRYFPDEDPVGKRVCGDVEIVAVVADIRFAGVRSGGGPMMYFLAKKDLDRVNALEVRTAGDAAAIAASIRAEIRRLNPRLFIGVRTMRHQIEESIATERMAAGVSAFFSLLGLLLASIGIFGVASHTVAQRTNELGIRMALGADRWSLIRESLRDTMLVSAAGLGVGIIAAVVTVQILSGFISELLFGLTPTDAMNIAASVLVIVVVALSACILPARRATRIDPLIAIRHE